MPETNPPPPYQKPHLRPYKVATTLEDLGRNFRLKYLDPEKHKHFILTELHQEKIREFGIRFNNSLIDFSFVNMYLEGYIGAGKTTFLDQFMFSENMRDRFTFIKVNFTDFVSKSDEQVNLIDFFVFMLYQTITDLRGKIDADEYTKRIDKKINEILNEDLKEEKQTQVEAKFSLANVLSFKAGSKNTQTIRQRGSDKRTKIITFMDQVFVEINEKLGDKKPVIILLDELEKNINEKALTQIVLKELNDLESVKVNKIIAIPPHITVISRKEANFNLLTKKVCHIELKLYPKGSLESQAEVDQEKQIIKKNRHLLKKLFYKRVAKNSHLIEEEEKFIDRAIQLSAGLLNQFTILIAESVLQAQLAGADKIRLAHLEKAKEELAGNIIRNVFAKEDHMAVLYSVLEGNNLKEKDLNDIAKANCVKNWSIVLFNSPKSSFMINPVIREAIESYYQDYKNRTE